jgi:hypothetical protein
MPDSHILDHANTHNCSVYAFGRPDFAAIIRAWYSFVSAGKFLHHASSLYLRSKQMVTSTYTKHFGASHSQTDAEWLDLDLDPVHSGRAVTPRVTGPA